MANFKTLYFVGTSIGNLDDITIRALKILSTVDIILSESLTSIKKLLKYHQIPFSDDKIYVYDEKKIHLKHIQEEIIKFNKIAYVSDSGMPVFMDPGIQLFDFAEKNQYRIQVIPGITALSMALVFSKIKSSFYFAGFPPLEKEERWKFFKSLTKVQIPIFFYETPYRIPKLLLELKRYFTGTTRITFFFNLSSEKEKIISFFLKDSHIYQKEIIKAPAVILIQK